MIEILNWLAFFGGVVIGVAARMSWEDVWYGLAKEKFEDITVEQGKEIARLRAQVANLIGKA